MDEHIGDIMVNTIQQSQKDRYSMIALIGGTWNCQIHGDRKQNDGHQGLREGQSGKAVCSV